MMERQSELPANDPLLLFFRESIHDVLRYRLGVPDCEDVEAHLSWILAKYGRKEAMAPLHDGQGRPIEGLVEMLGQADVRLSADSFERERDVHQHIGDSLLFWSGLYPERLRQIGGDGYLRQAARQGQASYHIVSSFDHEPYRVQAPVFQKLGDGFEVWREGLSVLRLELKGFPRPEGSS